MAKFPFFQGSSNPVKSAKKLFLLSIFVIGWGFLVISGYKSLHPQSDGLSGFILGTWTNHVPGSNFDGAENVYYQLEFRKPDLLILNRMNGEQPLYNLLLHYKVDAAGQLIVTGREGGIFHITHDGEYLIIQSERTSYLAGRYMRKPTVEWSAVAFLLALGIFGISSASFLKFLPAIKISRDKLTQKHEVRKSNLLISILFIVIASYIGWAISEPLWQRSFITTIRLPWDALITIELSLLMILMVFWILSRLKEEFPLRQILSKIMVLVVGFLLLGMSLNGLFLGIIKLIVFVTVGGYPQ